jgi:hypothetical protein
MWARVIEIILGSRLMASPFIFRFAETDRQSPASDLLCGLLVIIFGSFSDWNRSLLKGRFGTMENTQIWGFLNQRRNA